jgi:hypothetical protein
MNPAPGIGRVGAWLALVGLLLQIGLGAAHSARHFDHLVGALAAADPSLAAAWAPGDREAPPPGNPAAPQPDRCAIDLGLAAVGNVVLAEPGLVPRPLSFEIARLDGESRAIEAAARRHSLPLARAPPAIEISA